MRSHLKAAQLLNKRLLDKKTQHERLIRFESEYKNDELTLQASSIILIRAADNYIELFYEREGSLQRHTIRNTLKNAEMILQDFDYLFRCHRSFIINVNYLKEIQGNSQGYRLYFEKLDFYAAVSQNYIPEFEKRIK